MCMHMSGLRLWEFLMGEFSCPLSPSAHAQPVLMERTTTAGKERLLLYYDDRLASYECQYSVGKERLLMAGSVLVASIEDQFSTEIVELERAHQMWTFLHSHYEPTEQSTFLDAIRQEQLLRQRDPTIVAFFEQLYCLASDRHSWSSVASCHLQVMQGSEGCS
jgi:hypothetical protein